MKFLLFSDVHCDVAACESLVRRSKHADVVIGAGDFGWLRSGLLRAINVLAQIKTPTVLVPGNCESIEELADACTNWPAARVLHGSGTTIAGVEYYGLGGGVPVTPFGPMSYDFTEEQARKLLQGCPDNAVLVTHSPPHGGLDISSTGRQLGSQAVRECILRTNPRLVVCGHIHGSSGKVVNQKKQLMW